MQDAMVIECVREYRPFKEPDLAVLAAFTSPDVTLEVSNPAFIRRSHDEWVRELVSQALQLRRDIDAKVISMLSFWDDSTNDSASEFDKALNGTLEFTRARSEQPRPWPGSPKSSRDNNSGDLRDLKRANSGRRMSVDVGAAAMLIRRETEADDSSSSYEFLRTTR
jgi:hypothetical protein